jgi:hypothetical protein
MGDHQLGLTPEADKLGSAANSNTMNECNEVMAIQTSCMGAAWLKKYF